MAQGTEPTTQDLYAEVYGVVCDAVERAWQHWPVERGADEAPVMHSSAYARQAANRVMEAITSLRGEAETTSLNEVSAELEDLCEKRGWDLGIKVETGTECAWSAEVRVTQQPNQHGTSDRSLVTFTGGGFDADDALAPAIDDMLTWLNSQEHNT